MGDGGVTSWFPLKSLAHNWLLGCHKLTHKVTHNLIFKLTRGLWNLSSSQDSRKTVKPGLPQNVYILEWPYFQRHQVWLTLKFELVTVQYNILEVKVGGGDIPPIIYCFFVNELNACSDLGTTLLERKTMMGDKAHIIDTKWLSSLTGIESNYKWIPNFCNPPPLMKLSPLSRSGC